MLVRTNAQLVIIEQELAELRVPCRVRTGPGPLGAPEVKAVLKDIARRGMDLPRQLEALDATVDDMAESGIDGRPTAFDVDRYNNLAALSRLIHEYMTVDPQPTGSGLLAWVETLDGGDVTGGDDAVDLVTFHGAKGLEWSVVHVAGLENGFVPIAYAATPAQLAEEQRLVYVALTRAQDHLQMSWCRERTFGTKSVARTPSPLIAVLQQAMTGAGGTGPVETDWRSHIRRSRRAIEGRATLGSIDDESNHSTDHVEAEQLYQSLRSWRDRKAKAGGVPPHVIVSDQVLRTVARHRPTTTAQLAAVTDLRPAKLARLGPDLLARIESATPHSATLNRQRPI